VAFARRPARNRVRNEDAAEQLDALAAEHPGRAELPAVQQHLRELEVVLRRAEEPAAAREIGAVHERQVRRPLETAVGAPIERRETRVLGRKEERIGHSERLEDAFLRERIERAAGRDLDDADEHVESELAAVRPARAGLEIE